MGKIGATVCVVSPLIISAWIVASALDLMTKFAAPEMSLHMAFGLAFAVGSTAFLPVLLHRVNARMFPVRR